MVSVGEHDSTLKKSRLAFAFKIGNLSKKICDIGLGRKGIADPSYLRTHPVNLQGETTCSREFDWSTTLPESSLQPPSAQGATLGLHRSIEAQLERRDFLDKMVRKLLVNNHHKEPVNGQRKEFVSLSKS